jgi:hypothetical protein
MTFDIFLLCEHLLNHYQRVKVRKLENKSYFVKALFSNFVAFREQKG